MYTGIRLPGTSRTCLFVTGNVYASPVQAECRMSFRVRLGCQEPKGCQVETSATRQQRLFYI